MHSSRSNSQQEALHPQRRAKPTLRAAVLAALVLALSPTPLRANGFERLMFVYEGELTSAFNQGKAGVLQKVWVDVRAPDPGFSDERRKGFISVHALAEESWGGRRCRWDIVLSTAGEQADYFRPKLVETVDVGGCLYGQPGYETEELVFGAVKKSILDWLASKVDPRFADFPARDPVTGKAPETMAAVEYYSGGLKLTIHLKLKMMPGFLKKL